ncbi:hypothetical protein [Paraburkholderia caballeronis]|uniref:hypothetical protein n=1 Tax=Paraburkholderia caballeronis TaxID=416943 RepID=UPI001066CA0B|nr:hypothetical protein [Paraburkholderia caballeronis]
MKSSARAFAFAIFCSAAFVTVAHAEDEKLVCSIKKAGVTHNLTVRMVDKKISDFDYLAVTQSEAGKNSCAVHPGARDIEHPNGSTTVFRLFDSDIAIIKVLDNVVTLDLSNINLMNYCGQSATIASEIRLKKGIRRCLAVINQ